MARTTNQIHFNIDEDLREDLNRLEDLYSDFKVPEICKNALRLAVRRYTDDITRIREDIKITEGKIYTLEEDIDNINNNKSLLEVKLKDLKQLEEEMYKEKTEREPKMLFRNAVYKLSTELEDPGEIDQQLAESLAEEIGVPVESLINTAYELFNHEIELNEVDTKMPTLGDIRNLLPSK